MRIAERLAQRAEENKGHIETREKIEEAINFIRDTMTDLADRGIDEEDFHICEPIGKTVLAHRLRHEGFVVNVSPYERRISVMLPHIRQERKHPLDLD